MATVVKMHYAKAHLSALVERALGGEEVVIARDDRPLVPLVPLTPPEHPRPAAMAGELAPMTFEDFRPPTDEELAAMGFDRLPIAAAGIDGLTPVSGDAAVQRYPVPWLW